MEVGGAPFYVYDRQLMSKRMNQLRSTLPDGLIIKYAIKANPMPAVVQHMSSHRAVGESDSVTGPALAVEHTHHAEEVYGTLKAVRNLSAV
jgi:diaminopimelate decarboxylase